jgi:hypothetical protein
MNTMYVLCHIYELMPTSWMPLFDYVVFVGSDFNVDVIFKVHEHCRTIYSIYQHMLIFS